MFKLLLQLMELLTTAIFLIASLFYFCKDNMQMCLLTFIASGIVFANFKLDKLLEEKRSVRDSN